MALSIKSGKWEPEKKTGKRVEKVILRIKRECTSWWNRKREKKQRDFKEKKKKQKCNFLHMPK